MVRCRKVVRVYDILNSGPNKRFTVSNVLAHNCFALLYGAEWKKIHQTMIADRNKADGKRTFPGLKEKDCQEWEANWHRLHPETRAWHERCHSAFRLYGFTGVPMLDYRKRFFPGGVAQANAIPNATIQGSAASIANQALIRLADVGFETWSPWSGIAIQVHDYFGVIVPETRAREAARIVEECMYHEHMGMKFDAQAEISWDWGHQ